MDAQTEKATKLAEETAAELVEILPDPVADLAEGLPRGPSQEELALDLADQLEAVAVDSA